MSMFGICDARVFENFTALDHNCHRLYAAIPFMLKLEFVFSSSDEDWEEQL